MMNELTANDRGVFLVKTQGSEHEWTITDEEIFYVRRSNRPNRSFDGHNGRRLYVERVQRWPKVGESFYTVLYSFDLPWHVSSQIRSIERIS